MSSPTSNSLMFEHEAYYLYNFEQDLVVSCGGWQNLIGVPDADITVPFVMSATAVRHKRQSNELNAKAIQYIGNLPLNDRMGCCLTMYLNKLHQNGTEVPVRCSVGVVENTEDGQSIVLGRFSKLHTDPELNNFRYEIVANDVHQFLHLLNNQLFPTLNERQVLLLKLLQQGFTYKQIAESVHKSRSSIEKQVYHLMHLFAVETLPELIIQTSQLYRPANN
ncbi:MAG: hypothetical protein EAY72_08795 [Bacteroidetes bacterium]|nr:MAG: hypothetical protein EAY72_08795 [Bacteroidota bacterium]